MNVDDQVSKKLDAASIISLMATEHEKVIMELRETIQEIDKTEDFGTTDMLIRRKLSSVSVVSLFLIFPRMNVSSSSNDETTDQLPSGHKTTVFLSGVFIKGSFCSNNETND